MPPQDDDAPKSGQSVDDLLDEIPNWRGSSPIGIGRFSRSFRTSGKWFQPTRF